VINQITGSKAVNSSW